ncbi:MAG TPA: SDR family oxidoreductase [Acidimicrobiales bacterium]|nr:SDR family oxidoreductase [Acidimicrobiales bacterium]
MPDEPSPAPTPPSPPRTVAVTGSASGIGAAVRRRIERHGDRVIGVDLRAADITADLATAAGRARAVHEIHTACGGVLDALVACAGVGPQTRPRHRIVEVNYFGALACIDGALEDLARGESPAAVVISSNGASLTPPDRELLALLDKDDEPQSAAHAERLDGATVYGTAKLALTRQMRRRAQAWAEAGVRLNAVAPGPVDTPLLTAGLEDAVLGPLIEALPVPIGRRAEPDEIAAAVAFLLHPDNGFVHGSVLFVDGGSDALLRPEAI